MSLVNSVTTSCNVTDSFINDATWGWSATAPTDSEVVMVQIFGGQQ